MIAQILSLLLLSSLLFSACGSSRTTNEPVRQILSHPPFEVRLPPGFRISYYAAEVPGARSLTRSPDGTVFVGTREEGVVYALIPNAQQTQAQSVMTVLKNLHSPNGVAFFEDTLYVAEVSRVLKYPNILHNLATPLDPEIVIDDLPKEELHGWKFIAIGPDRRLYVPIGSPCNICNPGEPYASITSYDLQGANKQVVSRGIRNTVGFDWQPMSNTLWFTDNGRDALGDTSPPDELNQITVEGQHFGYPFCHGESIQDPLFGSKSSCTQFSPPKAELPAHVAALGMRFYTGNQFPREYVGRIFVAEHGSWDRSEKIGYRVAMFDSESNKYETFADGWLDPSNGSVRGRPVDVLVMPDGSLLVSDDEAGAVYRISYEP
jgi:glucose/arabinose dehydrogenase